MPEPLPHREGLQETRNERLHAQFRAQLREERAQLEALRDRLLAMVEEQRRSIPQVPNDSSTFPFSLVTHLFAGFSSLTRSVANIFSSLFRLGS